MTLYCYKCQTVLFDKASPQKARAAYEHFENGKKLILCRDCAVKARNPKAMRDRLRGLEG